MAYRTRTLRKRKTSRRKASRGGRHKTSRHGIGGGWGPKGTYHGQF